MVDVPGVLKVVDTRIVCLSMALTVCQKSGQEPVDLARKFEDYILRGINVELPEETP